MKTSRILVLKENAGPENGFRLSVLDHTVEFEYRSAGRPSSWKQDIASYAAVAAPIGLAKPDIVRTLAGADGASGVVFLYRGDPPLHEMARWVLWETPEKDGLEFHSIASLYRQCLGMMSSPDEANLLSRITDAFGSELAAGSCAIWLATPGEADELMIASARGSIGIEAEGSRFRLSQSGIAEQVWKGDPFVAADAPHLYVPLRHQEKVIGLAKLGERNDGKPYGERDVQAARLLSGYAASALDTVSRLGRIDKLSLRDPETGVHSAAFLADYLDKELRKANRFHRPLSRVFLQLENPHLRGGAAPAR
ncbi:MAG: GAF domain-containing protein, partial [Thermodesulfobacteriota bacterium]